MSSIPHKVCVRCGVDKPLSDFSKQSSTRDGKHTYCKVCASAYYAEYYRKNKQEIQQNQKAYRLSYYERNREMLAQKRRDYLAAYPERVRAAKRAWEQRNPDKRREGVLRRRARIRQNRVDKVDYAVIWERDGGICHICGGAVDRSDAHFDHVIALANGGAHSMDNIKVAHSLCNVRKNKY